MDNVKLKKELHLPGRPERSDKLPTISTQNKRTAQNILFPPKEMLDVIQSAVQISQMSSLPTANHLWSDKKYRVDVDEEPYLSDNNSQRNIRWKANSASSNQYAFSNSNSRKRSCFLPVTGSRPLTPHAHAQLMDGRHYRVNPAADTCSDFIITSYRTPSTSWFRKHPSSSAGG
ncbi:hypothetical protein J6590_057898 [Homalodisca vitripennis]|nr:hypothetical protein J6590_057898 [Homalodisca vitripennis]